MRPQAGGVAPLVVPLDIWPDPIEALASLATHRMPVLLHGAAAPEGGRDLHRWSLLAADPFETVTWSPGQEPDPPVPPLTHDPFDRLDRVMGLYPVGAAADLPFAGGAIGYLGYEAGRAVESIRPSPHRRPASPRGASSEVGAAALERMPVMMFGLYAWGILWDHARRRCVIVSTGWPWQGAARESKARDDAARAAELMRRASAMPPARPNASGPGHMETPPPILGTSVERRRYLEMVEEARRLIARGDLYQVNLSQRLELPAPGDPLTMFRGVVRHGPAPFSAYLDAGSFQVISASPERFVCLRGREVESRPIKGTRPRGRTPARDRRLAEDLLASPKDRAENIMIVDLVRNDLGRVCEAGSVTAGEVCGLESYASVHHLVSTVRGALRPDHGRADLLRALFPGGSMTGAPKVRAMQVIEDLEPVPRGIYAGALGYLSFCGDMDLSIVIRTAVIAGGRAWVSVGGGVVADSDPAAEWQESMDKAASLLKGMAATSSWGRPATAGG